jgi:hypothetical protein
MIPTAIYLPLLALAATVPQPPEPSAATTEGTPSEADQLDLTAELHGGYHTPLGGIGLAMVLPFSRLAIGGGLGFGPSPSSDNASLGAGRSPLRLALFGRFAAIQGERFRLSLATGISFGAESDTAMAGDSQLFWNRDGNRYDLGAGGELAAGPAWVGVEAGVGYLAGTTTCTQLTANVYQSCSAGQNSGAPSNWVPYLGLTIRPRDRASAFATDASGTAATRTKLRVIASGTAIDGADVFSDGHFDGDPDYSGGLEGDILLAPGPHFRVGVGVRYELAHVPAMFGRAAGPDHFLSVPLLVGAAIPLQRRHELELLAGIGVGAGLVRGGDTSDGSVFLRAVGLAGELSVTYWAPVTRTVDLSLGAAITFAALDVENGGGPYFQHSSVLRGAIPLRIGARWSL